MFSTWNSLLYRILDARLRSSPAVLGIALLVGGVLAAGKATAQSPALSNSPNIILLVADDLGYGELGCQGNPEIPTPGIDRLAAEGIRFTQAYVTASYCSPSRAGLLSGQYQTRFGHELNPVGDQNLDPLAGMPAEVETLAERLQSAGYRTALIGKWHLGGSPKLHPQQQGFETFYGFLHEGHFYVPPPYAGVWSFLRRKELPDGAMTLQVAEHTLHSTHLPYDEPPYDLHNPVLRGTREIDEPLYFTDAITREARRFIEAESSRPFFMCVSYSAVHSPMQAPIETVQQFDSIQDLQRRIFAGMLTHLDRSVAEILDSLHANGCDENTLVVFLSDNGGPTRELTSSNAPLRGGKGSLYEGGIRVPTLVRWPRQWRNSRVYERPVISLDWTPTILAAAGVPVPQGCDGVDLLPFLEPGSTAVPHEQLYWRMGQQTALRSGDWKIIARQSGWVADSDGDQLSWQLYHLGEDPSETRDRASSHPEQLAVLVDQWSAINSQMVPPRWRPQQR